MNSLNELLKTLGISGGGGITGGALFALVKWLIEKWIAKKRRQGNGLE